MKTVFIALILGLSVANAQAQSGMDAFNQKRYDAAYRGLINEAEAGQPAPMFAVGRMFLEGLGSVPKDTNKGISFLARSADKSYEPAIKYLAEYYERTGNLKEAIRNYERLKDKGDLTAIKKLVELNEKVFNKEKTLSLQYCNSLESARVLGEKIDELRYATCIIDGKNSSKQPIEAINLLKKLASAGNTEASAILIPKLVAKQADNLWDPIYAEQLTYAAYISRGNFSEAKRLLERSDLDHESCALYQPKTNAQQQIRRAVCRLNAYKGDQKTATLVAEGLIQGVNGFSKNPGEALVFSSMISDARLKAKLQLSAMITADVPDYSNHKSLLQREILALDAKEQALNLDFYIKGIVSSYDKNPIYRTANLSEDSSLILKHGDCKNKTDYRRFVASLPTAAEGSNNLGALLSQLTCTDPIVERGTVSNGPVEQKSEVKRNLEGSKKGELNRVGSSTAGVPPPQATSEGASRSAPTTSAVGALLARCDQEADICAEAAQAILETSALGDDSTRRTLAIETLERGIKAGSDRSKLKLVDVLDSSIFLPPSLSQRLEDLIREAEKSTTDAWVLRRARARAMSLDPLSHLLRFGEISRLCDQTRLIALKPNLPLEERVIASRVLASPSCKTRE